MKQKHNGTSLLAYKRTVHVLVLLEKIAPGALSARKHRINCSAWHFCTYFLYFLCAVIPPYLSWYVLSFDLEMACSSCPRWWFVVDSWLSHALSSSLFFWRASCLCCFSDSRSRIALQKITIKSGNTIHSDLSCKSQEHLPTIKRKDFLNITTTNSY